MKTPLWEIWGSFPEKCYTRAAIRMGSILNRRPDCESYIWLVSEEKVNEVRRGQDRLIGAQVTRTPRTVTVHHIELLGTSFFPAERWAAAENTRLLRAPAVRLVQSLEEFGLA